MRLASRFHALAPRALTLAVVAPLLASCTDAFVPQPHVAVPAYLTVAVHCVTNPLAQTTRCGPTQGAVARTPAAARDSARQLLARVTAGAADPDRGDRTRKVIIGGQDQYLRVLIDGGTYNVGNGTYTNNVILQNLLGQPMGTLDGFSGADSTFAKVFFVGGTGAALVSNPTGVGTFTASGQKYFEFPQVLLAGEWSINQPWVFAVGNPPTLFDYSLLVSMRLPDESARGFYTTPGDSNIDAAAMGSQSACIVRPIAQLYCWGDNSNGQLANGRIARTGLAPITFQDPPGQAFTQIVGGESHACGLTAGGIAYCWGNNGLGELGRGTTGGADAADSVSGGDRFLFLAAGGRTTCGVRSDHAVLCWGENQHGQVGDGAQLDSPIPVLVVGLPAGANEVAVGERHACAVLTTGEVWCWGANEDGQLGNVGVATVSLAPVLAHAGPDAHVTAGIAHTCALTSAGGLARCWGRNAEGQLGNGSGSLTFHTAQAVTQGAPYGVIAAGGNSTCALNITSLATECWGENTHGQLGDASFIDRRTPRIQSGPALNMVQLSVGTRHGCGRTAANTVYCWGDNNALQLPVTAGFGAVTVPTATSSDGLLVAAGSDFTCLRATTGTNTLCAGTGAALPPGLEGGASANPLGVVGALHFTDIALGDRHGCGLAEGGLLACWGANDEGQLGQSPSDVRPQPLLVPHPSAGRTWLRVVTGRAHACAIDDASALYCWGANRRGQVGIGSFTNAVATPVLVLANVIRVAAGEEHTCVIRTPATPVITCWGRNVEGQLGIGSNVDQASPVNAIAPSNQNIKGSLTAGGRTTCATYASRSSGVPNIYCWGANEAGQLGSSGADRSLSPVVLAGGVFFVDSITLGRRHGCGGDYCWGDNSRFQQAVDPVLGPFLTPTQVAGLNTGGLLRSGATADRTCVVGFGVAHSCWGGRQTRGEGGAFSLGTVVLAPFSPILP